MNIHDLTLARQMAEAGRANSAKGNATNRATGGKRGLAADLMANANDFAAELERMSQNGKVIPESGLPTPSAGTEASGENPVDMGSAENTKFAGPEQLRKDSLENAPSLSSAGSRRDQQELNELMQLMQMAGKSSGNSPAASAIAQASALVLPKGK